MIGQERGKGGNLVAWLILGILAIAFVFTFGLPSDQVSLGQNGLVKVHGEPVGNEDFVYQTQAIARVIGLPEGEEAQTFGVREEVLEAVIERLVLGHVGEELGLMTETRDAEMLTKDGFRLVLDEDVPYPWAGGQPFDYQQFKAWLTDFGVSEARYLEIQRQELLARQVRDLLMASTTISEPELWAAYEKDNNQLSLSYVRFPSSDYADLVDPTDAEIDAWMTEHEAELAESWELNQPRFLKLPPQVDLRLIAINKPIAPPPGSDAELVADHEARMAAAKASAEAARKRIVEGGEPFATVARELSQHADTARSGGRFGWTIITEPGSGLDPIIDSSAATLADAAVSEVIEGEESFYVIMVAGHREGDVPEDLAKRELAAEAVRSARGKELAQREADEALLAIKEGATLDQLFAKKPALGQDGENIEDYPLGSNPDGGAVAKPDRKIDETGLFTYGEAVPGIGAHPGLTNAAWESDPNAAIIPEVFVVPGGFLLAKVEERKVADKAGFADARAELYQRLILQRANSVLVQFAKHQCYLSKARVDIRINDKAVDQLMSYDGQLMKDEKGVRLTPPYRVCARVGERGGALRLQMALRGRGM
ncbi:MAG TPA: SurA N-terminal domain-containing protein [Enhygromyxa sp.]|nr:SurA N-terminal domain-containing protein [Enhygromyxa sp.]